MSIPIVKVKQGRIKGILAKNVDGGDYLAFRGIPYAEPPIGDLRFKDPRPPQAWSGIRDVGDVSPKAAQYDFILGITSGSEDCLYLNVATNSLIGKRPVMVWIHGGGFAIGSANNDLYGPDYLLKRDIVFVGITYRLGSLGFLNLGLPEAAGNQGLKDQVAGLKWVQENIAAFGGDPENVTIFGESAGAAAVHFLTLAPLAQGLFHKAIAQSGVANNPWIMTIDPVETGLRFVEKADKRTNDPEEALKYLMTLSTKQIIEAQRKTVDRNSEFELVFNFLPTVDRESPEPFMPEPLTEMMKRGVNVPLLIGFMSDEGIITTMNPDGLSFREINKDFASHLARDLRIREIDRVAIVAGPVRKFYFGDGPITLEKHKNAYAQLKGDVLFVNGIQQVVDIQSDKSTPTYLFRFSYRPSYPTIQTLFKCDIEGTCHSDELNAIFHSKIFMSGKTHRKGTPDRLVMKRMTRMWANFAETGNPTPELDEVIPCKWEPVTKDSRNYLEINNELTPGVNPCDASWQLWKPILKTLQ